MELPLLFLTTLFFVLVPSNTDGGCPDFNESPKKFSDVKDRCGYFCDRLEEDRLNKQLCSFNIAPYFINYTNDTDPVMNEMTTACKHFNLNTNDCIGIIIQFQSKCWTMSNIRELLYNMNKGDIVYSKVKNIDRVLRPQHWNPFSKKIKVGECLTTFTETNESGREFVLRLGQVMYDEQKSKGDNSVYCDCHQLFDAVNKKGSYVSQTGFSLNAYRDIVLKECFTPHNHRLKSDVWSEHQKQLINNGAKEYTERQVSHFKVFGTELADKWDKENAGTGWSFKNIMDIALVPLKEEEAEEVVQHKPEQAVQHKPTLIIDPERFHYIARIIDAGISYDAYSEMLAVFVKNSDKYPEMMCNRQNNYTNLVNVATVLGDPDSELKSVETRVKIDYYEHIITQWVSGQDVWDCPELTWEYKKLHDAYVVHKQKYENFDLVKYVNTGAALRRSINFSYRCLSFITRIKNDAENIAKAGWPNFPSLDDETETFELKLLQSDVACTTGAVMLNNKGVKYEELVTFLKSEFNKIAKGPVKPHNSP